MTRSIFDPTSSEMEQEGSRYLPPAAAEISQVPQVLSDGTVADATDDAVDPAAAEAAEDLLNNADSNASAT